MAARHGVPVLPGFRDSDHFLAAESRGTLRYKLHRDADEAQKTANLAGKKLMVITMYPSGWEEKAATREGFPRFGYRETSFDLDDVRGLKLHNKWPERAAGADEVLVVCNDVYVCDWRQFIDRVFAFNPTLQHFTILAGGLTLAGSLGAETISGRMATIWVKEGDKFVSFCPGAASEYVHKDTRPWKGRLISHVGDYKLLHKPESNISNARQYSKIFVTKMRESQLAQPRVDVPLRRSPPGAIILNGEVPSLYPIEWSRYRTGKERDLVTLLATADHHVEDEHGDLDDLNVRVGGTLLLDLYRKARKTTIERTVKEEGQYLPNLPSRTATETQHEADYAERAKEFGFFAPLLGTLKSKKSYLDTVVDFGDFTIKRLKQLYRYLVQRVKELIERFRNVHDEEAESSEEEFVVLQPGHVLYQFQNAMKGVSKLLATKTGTGKHRKAFLKASNLTRRIANLMGKPFEAETLLGLLGEMLLTLGVVALEEFVSHTLGIWGDIAITLFEIAAILAGSEGAIWLKLGVAIGHFLVKLLLAVLPWWISLPLHILLDLLGTGWMLRAVQEVIRLLEDRGLFKRELSDLWEKLRDYIRPRNPLFEEGEVTIQEMEVIRSDLESAGLSPNLSLDDTTFPTAMVQDFVANEWVNLSLSVNGEPIPLTSDGLALACLRSRRRENQVCYPLVEIPCLKNFTLTNGGPRTFLLALVTRYRSAKKPGTNRYLTPSLLKVIFRLTKIIPWTEMELLSHADGRWDAMKIAQYKSDFKAERHMGSHEAYQDAFLKEKPISGKAKENLRSRLTPQNEVYVKTRAMFPFPPAYHVKHGTILWAHGIKDALVSYLNEKVFTREGVPDLRIRVPKKGTAVEISELLEEGAGITALIAGDDGYDSLWTKMRSVPGKRKRRTKACDLNSCDIFLGDKIRSILEFFEDSGVPKDVTSHVLDMCTGPYTWTHRDKAPDGTPLLYKGVLQVPLINGSGHDLTTVLTLVVSGALNYLTWTTWNGDPSSWPKCKEEAALKLGVSIEFEGSPHGMNEIGTDTFLSTIPLEKITGRVVVVPKAVTKLLVMKGTDQANRGLDFAAALSARVDNPLLLQTHLGQAINNCFKRSLVGREVPPHSREPINPYKLTFDVCDEPPITLLEEAELYSRFMEATPEGALNLLIQEMAQWDSSELPIKNGVFPISDAMGRAHYNL
jgi:hypothetical protein